MTTSSTAPNRPEEAEFVGRLRAGDEDAYKELVGEQAGPRAAPNRPLVGEDSTSSGGEDGGRCWR